MSSQGRPHNVYLGCSKEGVAYFEIEVRLFINSVKVELLCRCSPQSNIIQQNWGYCPQSPGFAKYAFTVIHESSIVRLSTAKLR